MYYTDPLSDKEMKKESMRTPCGTASATIANSLGVTGIPCFTKNSE